MESSTPPRFYRVDPEVKRSPICGPAFLTNRRHGSPSPNKLFASKAVYEEMKGGGIPSPETESSASDDDHVTFSTPYMVQFDPTQPGHTRTEPLQKGKLPSDLWAGPLPAVSEEERSYDTEPSHQQEAKNSSYSSTEKKQESLKQETSYSSPEKAQILEAMRALVLKQQTALTELAAENAKARRELGKAREDLESLRDERAKQKTIVDQLTLEKEMLEAEVVWLKEEVKTSTSATIDTRDDESEMEKEFHRIMSKSMDDETDWQEANAFQNFKKALMSGTTFRSVLQEEPRDQPPREQPEGSYASARLAAENRRRQAAQQTAGHTPPRPSSDGDEVALFKSRLESIQKRRAMRRAGDARSDVV